VQLMLAELDVFEHEPKERNGVQELILVYE
jgi:hypothetical protein